MEKTYRRARFPCPQRILRADLTFYTEVLGLRLDTIFPADDPAVAVLSGHGLRIRLERGANVAPGVLRLLCRDPAAFADGERELTAPNGVRIQIVDANPRLETPPTQHAFVVRRLKDNAPLGDRSRGHAVSGSDSRPARRQHHRVAHPHPRRRARAGHGPLPHGGISVDLLLPRLGQAGVRGSRAAVRPAGGRLRHSAAAESATACSRRPRTSR